MEAEIATLCSRMSATEKYPPLLRWATLAMFTSAYGLADTAPKCIDLYKGTTVSLSFGWLTLNCHMADSPALPCGSFTFHFTESRNTSCCARCGSSQGVECGRHRGIHGLARDCSEDALGWYGPRRQRPGGGCRVVIYR